MNNTFNVPRGTSDILPIILSPDDTFLWEALESNARKICKFYGYREIRTPIYEDINLFKRSLGTTSDIVNKQLIELTSGIKGSLGEVSSRQEDIVMGYALRPEGTASVVRSYVQNGFDYKESLSKFFYIGPMFRGERPQKGRRRQFHQIGVEAIGPNSTSPFLDAEMIALSMHLLREFNVQNPKLKINSLGSREDKESISSWLRTEFTKHKNELCEDCQNRFDRNVFRVLDCKNEMCRKVVNIVIGEDKTLPLSENSRKYFEYVQKALKDLGIDYEISPHLVRGLDYYTHTVFEITAEGEGLGSQDAIGAGGRYNGLVHELGGSEKIDYGAIGFALGMERIILAMNRKAKEKLRTTVSSGLDVFIVAMKEEYQLRAFLLLRQLREAGISADMNFVGGSMKSQMGKADKSNARFTLILGEDEIKNDTVAVKNMQASRQETVEAKDIVNSLKDKLSKVAEQVDWN